MTVVYILAAFGAIYIAMLVAAGLSAIVDKAEKKAVEIIANRNVKTIEAHDRKHWSRLYVKDDGVWIELTTDTGASIMLNLSRHVDGTDRIRATLKQWAAEERGKT